MNFDRILPENFFNLFQSKHRSLYIDCLIAVYEKYEVGSILGMLKDDARDVVEKLLEDNEVGFDDLNEEQDDDEVPSYRELANKVLRRFEKCGWISIDVTNDYVEILNFYDYSISLILAFIEIKKDSENSLFADNFSLDNQEKAFKGYIFTIYTLLNSNTYDYGLLLNQVYKNTISFVREIRKVDHKLREFINLIDTKDNIKDLVELLSEYKDTVMDKAYFKLKTFDNVNKYKLSVIKKLEKIQEDKDIMNIIANDYMFISGNDSTVAMYTANKQINDCIDIFNSLDEIMDEIDKKNRDYISQTLSKVKYLLNDATDVAGLVNYIIRFYSKEVKAGREDSGYNKIANLFELSQFKAINELSLSTPRGNYKKNENNTLYKTPVDFTMFQEGFLDSFKAIYSKEDVDKLLDETIRIGDYRDGHAFINDDATLDDIIRLLYIVIYASSFNNYEVNELDDYIETKRYIIKNFVIVRRKK